MQVLAKSQYLLLQTASPDALVRLESTPLADQREEVSRLYFQEQHHSSIEDFLTHHIQRNSTRGGGLLMQVGAHNGTCREEEGVVVELWGPRNYLIDFIIMYLLSRSPHTVTSSHEMNWITSAITSSRTLPMSMHSFCRSLIQNWTFLEKWGMYIERSNPTNVVPSIIKFWCSRMRKIYVSD